MAQFILYDKLQHGQIKKFQNQKILESAHLDIISQLLTGGGILAGLHTLLAGRRSSGRGGRGRR